MSGPPAYEVVRAVAPPVSVLLQHNPGPMTLDGTNTWLLRARDSDVAIVIDPGQRGAHHPEGPDGGTTDGPEIDGTDVETPEIDGTDVETPEIDGTDVETPEIDGAAHLDAVLAAVPGVALVLVTHGHHDHVELAAAMSARSGAPVRAARAEHCVGAAPLVDGEVVTAGGLSLRVVATPGHTSDSLCFVLLDPDGGDAAVFTGDTILGRGTTVVAHPDGVLGPYLVSLERLQGLGSLPVYPGHGPERPALDEVAARYLTHREQRLEQVRSALRDLGDGASARQIVELVYADVDQAVWWAAELSVAAQLDYLRS